MADTTTARTVPTTFRYYARSHSPDPTKTAELINGTEPGVEDHATVVHDIRPNEAHYTLDDHAFKVINHPFQTFLPKDFDFEDSAAIRANEWPKLTALLTENLGARLVLPLDSVQRISSDALHTDVTKKVNGKVVVRNVGQPFHIVHCDWAPAGARNLLRAFLPTFFQDNEYPAELAARLEEPFWQLLKEITEAEDAAIHASGAKDHREWDGSNYKGPRWAHFSFWRPLETVERDPLAILDPSSLFASTASYDERLKAYSGIRIPHRGRRGRLPEYEGTNIMPLLTAAGTTHRWLYLSEQKPEEMLAIKLFDSEGWKKGSTVRPVCCS